MTWDTIWKALIPSVQSAVYALLAMLIGAGGTYAVNKQKPAEPPPIAQRTVSVATVPVKTDQTKLQLVGLQHSLDQIAEVVREINSKDYCGPKPQRAAAKAK
jgi:hypothetical protein